MVFVSVYNKNVDEFRVLSEEVLQKHLNSFISRIRDSKGDRLVVLFDALAKERMEIAKKTMPNGELWKKFGTRRFLWPVARSDENYRGPCTFQIVGAFQTFFSGSYLCVTSQLDEMLKEVESNAVTQQRIVPRPDDSTSKSAMTIWREPSLSEAQLREIQQLYSPLLPDKSSEDPLFCSTDLSFLKRLAEKTDCPEVYKNREASFLIGLILQRYEMEKRKYPDRAAWKIHHCEVLSFKYEFSPGKAEELTRYFQLVVETQTGFVRFPFSGLHLDRFVIPEVFKAIEQALIEAAKAKEKEKISSTNEEMFQKIALARYLLAHASPWVRGSAAIGEWMETLVFRALGVLSYPYQPVSNVDLDAFALPLDVFIQQQVQRMKANIFSFPSKV